MFYVPYALFITYDVNIDLPPINHRVPISFINLVSFTRVAATAQMRIRLASQLIPIYRDRRLRLMKSTTWIDYQQRHRRKIERRRFSVLR